MLLIKNCKLSNMADIWEEEYDILVKDGKIEKIEKSIDSSGCEVIDAKGRTVLPGFVDAHCHTGLSQTDKDTPADHNERTNAVMPGLRAVDAIDPYDKEFDDAIKYGMTTLVTGPGSANIMGGTFMAIKTRGVSVEARILKEDATMKMALGENPKVFYGQRQNKPPHTRMMSAALMRENLFKAREYHKAWNKHQEEIENGENPDTFEYDIQMHGLMRVFDGLIVKIHCHQTDDIMTAVRICEEFGLRYTIDHCTEGHLIVDELVEHGVECIVGPILGTKSKLEVAGKSLAAPAILNKAGVKFAVMTDNPVIPMDGMLTQLCMLVRNGLDEKAALKAVTIHAAEISGIEENVGTIEVGKDADIVIWNEHPLATMGEVGTVIIDGNVQYERKVDA